MSINWGTATSAEILTEMRRVSDYMVEQGGPCAAPDVIGTVNGWFSIQPKWKQTKVKKGPGKYRKLRVILVKL